MSIENGMTELERSKRLLERGKYHEAYESAMRALGIGFRDEPDLQKRHESYLEEKEAFFRHRTEAWLICGMADVMRSNKIRAIDNFKRSLGYDMNGNDYPSNAEAYHSIACLQAGMGDPEALEYFDKAITLDPANFDYWYNKAHTMFKLSDKLPHTYSKEADKGNVGAASIINFDTVIANMTEAIKCMDRSIELRKASGDRLDIAIGYHTRGTMYKELAVFEKGIENLQKAKWDYVKAAELSEPFSSDLARVKNKLKGA